MMKTQRKKKSAKIQKGVDRGALKIQETKSHEMIR